MKVNIYYGGRGVLDDPTLYVLDKMEEVLLELRVNVDRYNIYEHKSSISTLPQTMKDADGIILATTVEWLGIGGYMQQFLDACWLYGDKDKIATTYMQPIVMSTTYGEREAELSLTNAWETLGGLPCSGMCGYVEDLVSFQMNKDYAVIIEKKAENLYRTISQKMKNLPTSNQAVTRSVLRTAQLELTPQESEQLSMYVSDDTYVKQQKEDIEQLAEKFRGLMEKTAAGEETAYVIDFESHFSGIREVTVNYLFIIEGRKKPLCVQVHNGELICHYGQQERTDVYVKVTPNILETIIAGRMTFQRAFMTGEMTAKGDFKTLRMLDELFVFDKE
ncbi:MAG: SCP2 sterol-binding domain-containing protein [bacterium]|nr:SCP2 sterol-binding domain-containing protein [bacterium]